ncbi:MAG: hypothetical protein DRJ51_04935 [Thermoprotei archaeon]|nr:MAG: hypothetical protein DRJ51_04935 [Thermoprotei archaeon]
MSKVSLEGDLRILSLEIEGFRVFNTPQRFTFNSDIVVFLGPIGSGKTSILKAIEFGLFGTTSEVADKRLKSDDLINDFRDRIKVVLMLVDPKGNKLKILRLKRRGKRVRTKAYLNGTPLASHLTEDKLTKLFGLGMDEFSRQVYIKWDVLQDIISGSPIKRSKALDRLFGIEILEELYAYTPLRIIEERILESEEELRELARKLPVGFDLEDFLEEKELIIRNLEHFKRKLANIRKLITELESELLKQQKLKEEYEKLLQEKTLLTSMYEGLRKDLEGVAPLVSVLEAEYELNRLRKEAIEILKILLVRRELELLEKVSDKDLRTLFELLKSTVRLLEVRLEEIDKEISRVSKEILTYHNLLTKIKSDIGDLNERIGGLEPYRAEYEELVSRYGALESIRKNISEMELKLAELQNIRRERREALDLLKALIGRLSREGVATCPVCGRQLGKGDLEGLKGLMKKVSERSEILKELMDYEAKLQDLKRVEERMGYLESKLTELLELESELSTLREEAERLESLWRRGEELLNELKMKHSKIQSFIKNSKKALERIEPTILRYEKAKEMEKVESQLKELEKRIENLGFKPDWLKEVERKLNELRREEAVSLVEIKHLEKKRKTVEETLEKYREVFSRMEEVKRRIDSYKRLYEKIRAVKYSFRAIQGDLRKRMLSKVTERMNQIFRQLYAHPDYNELCVRVVKMGTEEGIVRSVYEIYAKRTIDGAWVPVYSKLSDGQKTIIALALLLALHELSAHNLGMLILDEPLLNIDEECRAAWVRTFISLGRLKQIIIATQDRRLVDELEKGGRVFVYQLRHGGIEGPLVKHILPG